MTHTLSSRTALCLVALALLSACGPTIRNGEPGSKVSLTRNFKMVGDDGKRYGTVELDPVNGGRVVDNDGRLIGEIVPPPR